MSVCTVTVYTMGLYTVSIYTVSARIIQIMNVHGKSIHGGTMITLAITPRLFCTRIDRNRHERRKKFEGSPGFQVVLIVFNLVVVLVDPFL